MKKIKTAIISGLLLAPALVAATPEPTVTTVDYSTQTVGSIIDKTVDWVLGFAGAIAVLFVVYAGILYVTAAGNKDRQENAKKTLTYAVIGLIVIVLARFIVAFVIHNLNTVTPLN